MSVYDKYNKEKINAAKENIYESLRNDINMELIYQTTQKLLPEADEKEIKRFICRSILDFRPCSTKDIKFYNMFFQRFILEKILIELPNLDDTLIYIEEAHKIALKCIEKHKELIKKEVEKIYKEACEVALKEVTEKKFGEFEKTVPGLFKDMDEIKEGDIDEKQ